MPFQFRELDLPGVILVEPKAFLDERGFFMETYRRSDFVAHGIDVDFVQDNHSRSTKGILRGLHYQKRPTAQGKLVRAVVGEIFDVAVDMRRGAPTFGKWVSAVLNAENKRMLYVPPWCAHGFWTLSDVAELVYKASNEYSPEDEAGVMWNDSDIGIVWPDGESMVNRRDNGWPSLWVADTNFDYPNPPC